MLPVDSVLARLNAQFEKPITPTIQTPRPTYSHHLNSEAGPSGTCTPSSNSTNPSPSSTLVSSATTVTSDQDYGLKHFLDFPPSDGVGSLGFRAKSWGLGKEIERYRGKATRYDLPFVDFNQEDEDKSPTPMQGRSSGSHPPGPPPLFHRLPATSLPLMPLRKRWANLFEKATKDRDSAFQTRCANLIVRSSESWTDDEMFDLARAFVWGASDSSVANANDYFADLAVSVRKAFSALGLNNGLEAKFSVSTRNAAIGTFLYCWNVQDSHKAIIYERAPTRDQARFVISALAHCNFIGSLYRTQFLSRSDTSGCIRVLFQNVSVIEHLVAVRNILFQAGTHLWKECADADAEMQELKEHLVKVAKRVQCDHALLLHPPHLGTVQGVVGYIISHLDEFAEFLKSDYESYNLPVGRTSGGRPSQQHFNGV